ncbi:hypothetical protein O6H91_Y145300 [Diphasiastrum complanatum]|nr:hypothetical protein O6H91_Y141600 [Diphasiastrum complanatum]KAJ7299825.1 hypothetical protein O6H91_Y145300 [Diphasiastrum complanatum]KAJ7299826.1 hypothetical protein O6H91_Y145300 [Diphasiastrum complanatum]
MARAPSASLFVFLSTFLMLLCFLDILAIEDGLANQNNKIENQCCASVSYTLTNHGALRHLLQAPAPTPSTPPINCTSACDYRCSVAKNHEPCLKYCNICCLTCHCVPSGTSGNKGECPCYNNWKNSKGGPKCP